MLQDPIIEEVRRLREEYAKQFNYDLDAMADHLRKREEAHPDRLVKYAPKPARRRESS